MLTKRSLANDFLKFIDARIPIRFDEDPELIPQEDRIAELQRILAFRRKREQLFGTGLFADAVWDLLLTLYLNDLRDQRESVSSLCLASATPDTTALRWIKAMEARKLLVRIDDPDDGRRQFLSITPEAAQAMDELFRFARRQLVSAAGNMSIAIAR